MQKPSLCSFFGRGKVGRREKAQVSWDSPVMEKYHSNNASLPSRPLVVAYKDYRGARCGEAATRGGRVTSLALSRVPFGDTDASYNSSTAVRPDRKANTPLSERLPTERSRLLHRTRDLCLLNSIVQSQVLPLQY